MSITRVAQAAKVSYATAWRIINNQPCSSEQAVLAVREAMGQLGYEPTNGKKRGRPAKVADGIRTHNIALLHLRKGTSIATSVLSLVQRSLAERNLNLIFAHGSGADSLPQAVRAGNVDGILGYGEFPLEALTPELQRIPAVWMMSRSDTNLDPWGDRVKTDHQVIGQLAAQYLMQRGHRNLAFMNPDREFTIFQQRLGAFTATTLAAGVTPQVFESMGTLDLDLEAERLVDQWLAASPRPTAVFVPVDRVTLRVYRHMERRGIQPGKDVEIVSCDNERELLTLMRPAPASIDLNRQTIARLAVERLLWRMKNGVTSPRVVITVTPTLVQQGAVAKEQV
jgi:DNA-binding LacI/PurR family transcriptional regulator